MPLSALKGFLYFLAVLVILHTALRVVRRYKKFPIPYFLTPLIDNPLRRNLLEPPDDMARRHGIRPGMRVLEIGPGQGSYTLAAARQVGNWGRVWAIDLEVRRLQKLQGRARSHGVQNVSLIVANVHRMPYRSDTFDLAYLMSVIGEIPAPDRAFCELFRVLVQKGTLAFSEILTDPDCPSRRWLGRKAAAAGFEPGAAMGHFFRYTQKFNKPSKSEGRYDEQPLDLDHP